MKRLFALLLVLTLLVPLAPAAAQEDDTVIVIGWEQEPDLLNPMVDMTFASLLEDFYARDVWDWDRNREIYPIMVEDIPTPENGLVTILESGAPQVTYKLRQGMLWSDGEEVTADDCLFWHTLRMDRALGTFQRGEYPEIVESLEKTDDYTLVLTYAVPWPDYLVDEYMECRYPEHVLAPILEAEGTIDPAPYWRGQGVVGYGPYIFKEWILGDSMTFEPNPNWDGDPPIVDRVIAKFIPETAQMLNALDTGEIDIAFQWPDDQVANYEALDNVMVWSTPGVYGDAVWINMRDKEKYGGTGHPALLDKRVREAIVYAMDRPAMAEGLIGPGIDIPKSWYPDQFWPEDLGFREYNPEKAAQLLDEAGWLLNDATGIREKDGEPLILRFYTTTRQLREDYQALIQEYLMQVGIGTQLIAVPGASVLFASFPQRGILRTGDWDIALFALSAEPLSPNGTLDWFGCRGIPTAEAPDGSNGWGFCDERHDELESLVETTIDPQQRMEYHYELEYRFFDSVVWNGLYLRPVWYALRTDRWNPDTFQNLGTLENNYFNKCEYWAPSE